MAITVIQIRLDDRIENERSLAKHYKGIIPGRKHDAMRALLIQGYEQKHGKTSASLFEDTDTVGATGISTEETTSTKSSEADGQPGISLASLAGDQLKDS